MFSQSGPVYHSTHLGAGAGGAIRPSSVPAGLLRQHFDTFRGMILETFEEHIV